MYNFHEIEAMASITVTQNITTNGPSWNFDMNSITFQPDFMVVRMCQIIGGGNNLDAYLVSSDLINSGDGIIATTYINEIVASQAVFKLSGGALGTRKFTLYKGNVNTPVIGHDTGQGDLLDITISLEFIKLKKH